MRGCPFVQTLKVPPRTRCPGRRVADASPRLPCSNQKALNLSHASVSSHRTPLAMLISASVVPSRAGLSVVSGTKRDMYGALDLTRLSSHVHSLSKPLSWSCWSSFTRLWLRAALCLIPEVEQPILYIRRRRRILQASTGAVVLRDHTCC